MEVVYTALLRLAGADWDDHDRTPALTRQGYKESHGGMSGPQFPKRTCSKILTHSGVLRIGKCRISARMLKQES